MDMMGLGSERVGSIGGLWSGVVEVILFHIFIKYVILILFLNLIIISRDLFLSFIIW